MLQVIFRAEIFGEDDQYTSLCPELNVSSFGDTIEEATESLQEAVEAFLEGCEMLGTLEDILEESGFVKSGNSWKLRERVSEEKVATLS